MRKQPLPLDPLNLIRFGAAIWTTDLIIARKIVRAVREQNTLITRAIRSGRSLIRSFQTDRKALPPMPDRAGTVTPAGLAASPKWVLVRGESGGNEAVLTTPLDGVPVAAATGSGSSAMSEPRTNSFVFLRSCHE